jgi:hypothetical protein
LDISKAHLKKEGFQIELMDTLNSLGAEGWELITAEGLSEASIFWRVSETVDILLLFKRRI